MADYEQFTKAYEELERWMAEPNLLPVLLRDAERLALSWQKNSGEEELKNEIVDRFGQPLLLQGGVVRALTGAGTNRMNIYTVRRMSEALARLLREDPSRFGGTIDKHRSSAVAIGYDARPDSDRFALEAAAVLLASGFRVRLTPECVPLPFLSFVTKETDCVAGLMITGGHSPANFSGLKFYDANGALLMDESSAALAETAAKLDIFRDISLVGADTPEFLSTRGKDGSPLLVTVDEVLRDRYLDAIFEARSRADCSALSVVLTTMNGSGAAAADDIFRRLSVSEYRTVSEQAKADGSFTTCPQPDPEKTESLRKALARAEELATPDLVLAISPDAGRLGAAVRDPEPKDGKGSYVPLSGTQLAALLLDYLCMTKTLPENPVCILTATASPMLTAIAEHYRVNVVTVKPGFRSIAEELNFMGSKGTLSSFFFAYDGSGGYLVSSAIRDKDAFQGALLTAEMTAFHKRMHKGVLARLNDLSEAYGYYREREIEFRVDDSKAEQLPMDIIDDEGVRIYVRKSRVDDKIKVNLALRKDTEEEASRALNAAEFTIRGKVKEWFRSTKH